MRVGVPNLACLNYAFWSNDVWDCPFGWNASHKCHIQNFSLLYEWKDELSNHGIFWRLLGSRNKCVCCPICGLLVSHAPLLLMPEKAKKGFIGVCLFICLNWGSGTLAVLHVHIWELARTDIPILIGGCFWLCGYSSEFFGCMLNHKCCKQRVFHRCGSTCVGSNCSCGWRSCYKRDRWRSGRLG